MRKIDVCLSPELLHLYKIENSIVVVVDILRATSCMVTALAHGVEGIIPVARLEECKLLQSQGYLAAAERDGKKAAGFDLGNSPFSYMEPGLKGKIIAMTTTNGTLAIHKSRKAVEVVIGSFLNLSALVNYLKSQPHDVLVLCAGWKGKVNMEDTLFAGALMEALQDCIAPDCDAPLLAQQIYRLARKNMVSFLQNSSHVKRLKKLDIHEDIVFCLTPDQFDVIPVLQGEKLVRMQINVEG